MKRLSIALLAALLLPLSGQAFADNYAQCVDSAAKRYSVAPVLIRAIMRVEGGSPGIAVKNRDGSFDYGVMQINSWWFDAGPLKKQYGLSKDEVRDNACTNIHVGTWILSHEIANAPSFWEGVGNYNSRQTRCKDCHFAYRSKVEKALKALGAYQ